MSPDPSDKTNQGDGQMSGPKPKSPTPLVLGKAKKTGPSPSRPAAQSPQDIAKQPATTPQNGQRNPGGNSQNARPGQGGQQRQQATPTQATTPVAHTAAAQSTADMGTRPGLTIGWARNRLGVESAQQTSQVFHRGMMQFNNEAGAAHVSTVTAIKCSAAYQEAWNSWKKTVADVGAASFPLTLQSPLAIGLGNPSPIEVGVSLHSVYGIPFIPGTAIKAIARRACNLFSGWPEGKKKEIISFIFGNESDSTKLEQGSVVFWDAWMTPREDKRLLIPDTVTVHHPRYYQSGGKEQPTDFDEPTPIPFVVVPAGTTFLFALSFADELRLPENEDVKKLLATAQTLVATGLQHLGCGAKTSSGYGVFATA